MSRPERTHKVRRGIPGTAWVMAGLAAFVAVDILLVALALGWGRDEAQGGAWEAPSQSTSQTRDGSEDEPEEPTPSRETQPESEQAQVTPRLLSVVSETVAWRSEGGACEERAEIELTVDGGDTWGSAYPATEGLGRPLWLSGADYTAVQAAIASGEDCMADGVRTYDSGATWAWENQVIANSVFVDPLDASVIRWGGERVEGPCSDITQVAVTGGTAAAVCQDGSLWTLGSPSDPWDQSEVNGAIAVSGSDGRWIAAVGSPDCNGMSLVEFGGDLVQQVSCVSVELGEATALDLQGNTLWVWAGDDVSVSANLRGGPNP